MENRWFKNAVIYCLDVDTFRDANGDGTGDFEGLRQSLSYLAGLGITCLWLLPFYPSPGRDNGYDITDYINVHPELGDLGDFVAFMHEARDRGIRVIVDLVVNHTSDQHPWFQAARRGDPKYRDYYVWRQDKPGDTRDQVVFPGAQTAVWHYDRLARAYYFHRFYDYQPDLNTANPVVRAEIKKVMAFWLALGVSGFRVDAAPFVISQKGPDAEKQPHEAFELLDEFRDFLSWRCGDAILLAEANVTPDLMLNFFGETGGRMNMVLNFFVNPHLFLAMAQHSPEPLTRSLLQLPKLPDNCHFAYFLRNHDELDLSRLGSIERDLCFREFGSKPQMQLYGRGIRRRLAPMLGGDVRRQMLGHSLAFSLPGTPIMWYGDEIGMGDDLKLNERDSVRTPMQWSSDRNAGFSKAPAVKLRRPVISAGPFDYRKVNVQSQRRDPESLLNALERLIRTRKEYPEIGAGRFRWLENDQTQSVFSHTCEDDVGNAVVALHNFSSEPVRVTLPLWRRDFTHFHFLFDQRPGEPIRGETLPVDLAGYGYSWLRLVP
ncbi:MAG TPA: alpha-amylase family protein [Chthoniobacterales bacterium]